MDLIQNRRRALMNDEISFLNIVTAKEFSLPSFPATPIIDVQKNENGSIILVLNDGSPSADPLLNRRKRIYAYSNSNSSGICESASDLTFLGVSNVLNFDFAGTNMQLSSLYWNQTLNKLWCLAGVNLIAEFDFNIGTLTGTFVQAVTFATWDQGNFYFSLDGLKLFTCNSHTGIVYNLSTAYDISTKINSGSTFGTFASKPFFYANGGYAFHSRYIGGSGQWSLFKSKFNTAYDYSNIDASFGYRQPFRKSGFGFFPNVRASLLFSNDLKKCNYFLANKVGVGVFDISAKFLGNGNNLGGVKLNNTIIA